MNTKDPNTVWSLRGLSSSERLVMLCLERSLDQYGVTQATLSELSYETELDRRTVQRAIGHMLDTCRLERLVHASHRKPAAYFLRYDDE
ncbi:hypothetical protein LCGC14_1470290 [marine sediment metagenome]|uniref:HTH marR-type domain-containing protein n=1 Tax=marine sediment metagenome TaxID=412755 RepID=A0A0F9JCJ0_9ZZZZ